MKNKQAMMGNSPLAQQMMKGSGMLGYSEGGPIKKDGFLTDKKGKPYARVHEGEHVVPSTTKKKLKKIVKELKKASKMHKSQADRIDSMASEKVAKLIPKASAREKLKAKIKDTLARATRQAMPQPVASTLKSVTTPIADGLYKGKKVVKKGKKRLKDGLITRLGGSTREAREMAVARVTQQANRQSKQYERKLKNALRREDFWKEMYTLNKRASVSYAWSKLVG